MKKYLEHLLHLSASYRVTPDFLIIGTQKGGTTALFYHLGKHPNVRTAYKKEVEFFNDKSNYSRGLNWYRSYFPTRAYICFMNWQRMPIVCGEATTHYLWHENVPSRVKQLLPNIKLIVLLRNPIERAFSHYQHSCKTGKETRTFAKAIESEFELNRSIECSLTLCGSDTEEAVKKLRGYLRRGVYVEQLERWFKYFSPDDFIILRSEDLFYDGEKVLSTVSKFLRLPNFRYSHVDQVRAGQYTEEIDPVLRDQLKEFYAPFNRELEQLLCTKFSWS